MAERGTECWSSASAPILIAVALTIVPNQMQGQECRLRGTEMTRQAEELIDQASRTDDWEQVTKLLDQAMIRIEWARDNSPDDPVPHWLAARVLAQRGELSSADTSLQQFVELQPECESLAENLRAFRFGGTEYDRFEDTTTVATPRLRGPNFTVWASFDCAGDQLCKPDIVQLNFHAVRDEWEYLENHELILLVDDKNRIRPELEVRHKGNVAKGGYVEEFMSAHVSLEQFAEIAEAGSVAFKLGPSESRLTDKQLRSMRQLLAKMMTSQTSSDSTGSS